MLPPNNEDIPPPKADFSAPPPYELTDSNPGNHMQESPSQSPPQSPQNQHDQLLQNASKLPTYEEVQLEKIMNEELPITAQSMMQPPPPSSGLGGLNGSRRNGSSTTPALTFIAIDTDSENLTGDNSLLGTDIVFITAFLVSFIFNWIGFLMLTCFCHTIAARYGALSGFGLSLAKWTLIVKHSTDFASGDNAWLWWLIMAFGFLICIRAMVQYISIKRTWRLLSASAQERLLFFY